MTRAAPASCLASRIAAILGPGPSPILRSIARAGTSPRCSGEAALVFKNGDLVVKNGKVTHYRWGKTLRLNPPPDKAMVKRMKDYHDEHYGLSLDWFTFPDSAISRDEPFAEVKCNS